MPARGKFLSFLACFKRNTNSNTKPQPTDTHVCTSNKRAAMLPAKDLLGKCRNSIGTTKKPSVVKLPHHRAAVNMPSLGSNIFFNTKNNNLKAIIIKYSEHSQFRSFSHHPALALLQYRPLLCRSRLGQSGC